MLLIRVCVCVCVCVCLRLCVGRIVAMFGGMVEDGWWDVHAVFDASKLAVLYAVQFVYVSLVLGAV